MTWCPERSALPLCSHITEGARRALGPLYQALILSWGLHLMTS